MYSGQIPIKVELHVDGDPMEYSFMLDVEGVEIYEKDMSDKLQQAIISHIERLRKINRSEP